MKQRTALIDGDVFLYQVAAVCETDTDWGGGLHTLHSDANVAIPMLETRIEEAIEMVEAKAFAIALSDSGNNFRRTIYPLYKSSRKHIRRPLLWKKLREHLIEHWDARLRPTLEGDDILGILATHPDIIQGEKVIVSIDKDMETIPGLWWRNTKDNGEGQIVEVTEERADWFHLFQTLTGDVVDGYPGCPGVGPKKAEKLFEEEGADWDTVVRAYRGADLTEEHALVQARCARILRAKEYNFKKKEPILWTPSVTTVV